MLQKIAAEKISKIHTECGEAWRDAGGRGWTQVGVGDCDGSYWWNVDCCGNLAIVVSCQMTISDWWRNLCPRTQRKFVIP